MYLEFAREVKVEEWVGGAVEGDEEGGEVAEGRLRVRRDRQLDGLEVEAQQLDHPHALQCQPQP